MLPQETSPLQAQLHPQDAQSIERLARLEGATYTAAKKALHERPAYYFQCARRFLEIGETGVAQRFYEWARVLEVALKEEARQRKERKSREMQELLAEKDGALYPSGLWC